MIATHTNRTDPSKSPAPPSTPGRASASSLQRRDVCSLPRNKASTADSFVPNAAAIAISPIRILCAPRGRRGTSTLQLRSYVLACDAHNRPGTPPPSLPGLVFQLASLTPGSWKRRACFAFVFPLCAPNLPTLFSQRCAGVFVCVFVLQVPATLVVVETAQVRPVCFLPLRCSLPSQIHNLSQLAPGIFVRRQSRSPSIGSHPLKARCLPGCVQEPVSMHCM